MWGSRIVPVSGLLQPTTRREQVETSVPARGPEKKLERVVGRLRIDPDQTQGLIRNFFAGEIDPGALPCPEAPASIEVRSATCPNDSDHGLGQGGERRAARPQLVLHLGYDFAGDLQRVLNVIHGVCRRRKPALHLVVVEVDAPRLHLALEVMVE